ncbi:MAG: T9SS type A sorting domain-containing protein [Reichenbachiella sp.]
MNKLILAIFCLFSIQAKAQIFDYYGPQPFDEILTNSFAGDGEISALSSLSNRSYVVILDAETKTKTITLDQNDYLKVSILDKADAVGSAATYKSLLSSIFQLIDAATHEENDSGAGSGTYTPLTGTYKLTPILHSYFALNSDASNKLINSDAGTILVADATDNGYLLISVEGDMSSAKIVANSQWTYNDASDVFEEDATWTKKWLTIDTDELKWDATESAATAFFIGDANDVIDLGIMDGSEFNPDIITYQTNATADVPDDATYLDDSKVIKDVPEKVSDDIVDQTGTEASAATAASAMLDEIEATLESVNASLRYPKEFYLALRNTMLEQVIASTDIYGTKLGANTIPHVYFTNATDDDGVPHPFMVIGALATSTRPNFLLDVNRPPGATPGAEYGESEVTRNGKLGEFLVKIPLKDYGLIDELLDNDLTEYGDLATDFDDKMGGATEKTVYNYVSLASCALAIDGVTIYPSQNNNLRFAVEDAEVTSSGIHVGGGLELHYHADGHAFNGNGINLYNLKDYEGTDHPPVIGVAYDGIALFGRYEADYSSMTGYAIALDEFGGHDHDDGFGYHYHAHTQALQSSAGNDFDEHFLMVGAWKGDINSIPGFNEVKTNQFDDEIIARYVGVDYEEVDPVDPVDPEPPIELAGVEDVKPYSFYPNTSKGYLTIESEESLSVAIYNLNGSVVYKDMLSIGKSRLDISHLQKGMYVLALGSKSFNATEMLIRE